MAERLMELDLKDQSVLDLGCGLGLTGIVAAAQQAQVLMGDNAVPSLLFAELNSWPWKDRIEIQVLIGTPVNCSAVSTGSSVAISSMNENRSYHWIGSGESTWLHTEPF